jgi:hypothetical protein
MNRVEERSSTADALRNIAACPKGRRDAAQRVKAGAERGIDFPDIPPASLCFII